MRLELVTAPASEPITLAEARDFCRVSGTDEDSLFNLLITAARIYAENYTSRALISQEWNLYLDCGELQGAEILKLPKGNILSIAQVAYYDDEGTLVVLPSQTYQLSGRGLALTNNESWPVPGRELDAFEIRFSAGYGAASADVPEPIRQAIRLLVAHWYENREGAGDPIFEGSSDQNQKLQIPFGVTALLQPYKRYFL